MRPGRLALCLLLALGLAGAASAAGGLKIVTDAKPATTDARTCLIRAWKALAGTGMVMESAGGSVYGSNEDRTITIRCDVPGVVLFVAGFFPEFKDELDPVEAAFAADAAAPLIPTASKSHQYSIDCSRTTSCEMDPRAVCKQAYATSARPSAKVMSRTECQDGQGTYLCTVDYELACN